MRTSRSRPRPTRRSIEPFRCRLAACLLALAPAVVAGQQPADPGGSAAAVLYDLVTEISMPNLDENMRYATTRERRCVAAGDLSRAFSMLEDVSLSDCRLVPADVTTEAQRRSLHCTGGHGTVGEATWSIEGRTIAGTLQVKLGGKNMTFHQRVRGRAIGSCMPDGAGNRIR
jgi:hypothetical protein